MSTKDGSRSGYGRVDKQVSEKQRQLRRPFFPPRTSLCLGLRQKVLPTLGRVFFSQSVHPERGSHRLT